jgi:hypothetical protein
VQPIKEERIGRITAYYSSCTLFSIPKGINLLSEQESEDCNYEKPFSWWVKYATLTFINADGEKEYIYGDDCCDNKHPESLECEPDDEDDE